MKKRHPWVPRLPHPPYNIYVVLFLWKGGCGGRTFLSLSSPHYHHTTPFCETGLNFSEKMFFYCFFVDFLKVAVLPYGNCCKE